MLDLEGFTVEELLDEGPTSTVYRARKDGAERTVVIKTLTDAYPSAHAVARMEHEYDIGATVESPHVVSYYDLLPHASSYALILEDFGATDARALVTGRAEPLGLGESLRVARQVALALGDLHAREIVHRDVSPGNVLWNRETGEVKLADFGLATRIPRSREAVVHPTHLQGTLAYISPEQTGRMNRAVDYRTDFYSLGATLWFCLTGSPPFLETDPMALIHAHIAKAPPHLTALRGDLPEVVAELVHRLLAKTSEERYQSAAGIVADLDHCIETLSDGGAIPTFQLGTQDAGRKFRISEKLYGREEEVAGLLRTFETAARGPVHLLLVSGLSGIGKSMLVNEVHKPMVARRAYFAEGKYDQLGMTDPLSAILQALTDLARQILTEDEDDIAEWRSRVLSAVGDGARVLTNLVPELSELLGEQPELLKLGAVEARERFERTLLRFLQAAAAPAHPLVLFLDDLQWADPASLRVLQQLLTSPDTRNTLVICAYRDNEVSPSHPFALALGEIESRGVPTSRYTLAPLPLAALRAFIGDSLERETIEVEPLAEAVLEKTGGNPFYVTQFLYSLADQGLIAYDDRAGRWEWDLEGITSLEVIESVVDLMVDRIGRYGEHGRTFLSLASCMGNHFDLETLSIIASTNPRAAARGLWEPLRDGLIHPLQADYEYYQWTHREHGDAPPPERIEYRFAHDRIQQAAYRRIPKDDIERVHLRIGRLLLEKTDEENRSERILDLVNHLNLGRGLIAEDERRELARLNLEAAYAAKEATAFDGALEYVRVAMDLLPEDPWEADYDLTYWLHRERIDGEFLAGQWDEATRFFQITLEKAREKAQIADLYQLRIRILLQSDRVFEATDFAVEGCRALGLEFPEDPDAQSELIARELAVFDDYMKSHTIQDLLDRPLMDDPDTAEMLGVLHETWSAAVMAGNANVVVWSAIKTVTLALELGNSVFTSGGYIGMSHVLSLNKRLAEADAIGRMAMELAQRFGDSFLIPKVNNTYCNFTNHFVHHMRDCLPIYEESYRHALLGGDSWWGAWAAGWLRVARLVCGFPLRETLEIQEKFHDYIVSSEYKPLEYYSFMDRQIILNFMGRTVDPLSFTTDDYEESEYVRYFEDTGFGLGLHLHWIYKAIVHWMHGAHELTPALLDEADKHVDFIRLTMPWIDHYFFSPLCAVQHVGSDDPDRDRWARDKVRDHLAQLREWERTGKENFTHRAALVEAEWLRVTGDDAAAVDAYQQAIAAAKEYGYLHHEAMANELAARHHLERGREQAAVGYLLEAHLLYSRWGGERKAEALEAEFPGVLARRRRDSATITATTDPRSITTSRTIGLDTVDLSTVLKASAAISAELNLARLLERLMAITMENAGAQKGVLLFEDEEETTVEAVASVDREDLEVLQGTPLTRSDDVPLSIVEHVQGTGDAVVLDDAGDSGFAEDPYVIDNAVKSVMCLPVVKGRRRLAVLYLENDRVSGAFPPDHVALLRMICTQAAVAIENARLYDTLEQKVELRTEQLAESNRELARGNEELAKKNEEILRQQTQLVHAEKMAALGQLVAGVAHEVNNPVTFVLSGIPAMKRSLDSLFEMVDLQAHGSDFEKVSSRLDRLMTAVTEGAERTAEIVNDLRSFSRLGEADVKEVDLGKALEATLGLLRYQCEDRIEIVCDVQPIPPVRCYASQVNQMLMNVLQNAIQAIPERGTVEVRVRPHGASEVCIGIKDSGVGMDEAVKAKLFEPFFTTRAVGSGRGLGLSITHSVVDRHGGRIELDSALGQGTEFRIYLPLEMSTP